MCRVDPSPGPGQRPQGRLILSFRKEWLAEIEKRLTESSLPRTKVFLERLGSEGIAEVVAKPARSPRLREHYGLIVTDELPRLIADDLLADRESPVAPMLAILLTGMWDAAKERTYNNRPVFDEDLYEQSRSRGLSLADFLDRQLRALHGKHAEAENSGLALDLLAYHTTPLGTAEQRTMADLQHTYGHRQDVLPALVQECRDLYLLVDPFKNVHGQPPASRLTHDTLAPHVRKRYDESDAPGQRARRILENRAVDWSSGKTGHVLEAPDLAAVEAGRGGMRRLDPVSGETGETRLVNASRQAVARHRRARLVTLTVLGVLLLIVSGVMHQATLYPAIMRHLTRQAVAAIEVESLGLKVEAYEVTNQRYRWCYASGVCSAPARQLGNYYQLGTEHYPVTGIDAWQAAVFCSWIGRRLPTLYEWKQLMTRGGATRWPWGDDSPTPERANLCYENCAALLGVAHEVGSHLTQATGGIYDIIGNVAEWTGTAMSDNLQQGTDWLDTNQARIPQRVAVVGGSFWAVAEEAMVASRLSGAAASHVGIRCVEPYERRSAR